MFGQPVLWRETHLQPRFLWFDARLTVVFLFTLMHITLWTVLFTLACITVLSFFQRKGVSVDSILRYLRARLVGRKRPARPPSMDRLPVDFGFETQEVIEAYVKREELAAEGRLAARRKAASKASKKRGKRK